jgi:hypothetical protein
MSDEAIEYLKNEKPLFENEPVTSDTTLNKQEIAKQTLDNEQQVGENVIKEDINQEINNAPIIQFPSFDKSCSQQNLTRFIVDNNLISWVPQQGAFIVHGRKGKYCVTLFPRETLPLHAIIFWLLELVSGWNRFKKIELLI